jgi:hypothetical protein
MDLDGILGGQFDEEQGICMVSKYCCTNCLLFAREKIVTYTEEKKLGSSDQCQHPVMFQIQGNKRVDLCMGWGKCCKRQCWFIQLEFWLLIAEMYQREVSSIL